ncbi:BZ3500_MvSof-1268-A1-R1_Chr1-2g01417 [Microbotryum saponariae]|uniref:BZ3500_MvSof-1268-A1-R1_Chr1-2g01417 protein n=1 Tax=Microbotryum saponariae TaxID=289078 RepID=A0A2X0MBC8_9BASI|nr:BZ3500_MvSof-1268-A1-R1_Chr1-2g01417 [Microbotryum saponariae]SCZ97374.1 BZ3501_MvSof-1269-A2-R1_Chr1-2g01016 [Microbotryum saponariae]
MSASSSEKRRSQFIHVSTPSYGGSNGAVPPLPFLPLPPEEPPKSTTAIYAATPLQPQRQPSQGYVPGSLPARFGRSFSPPTSPTPTFPYTPTVTPPVSSYGGHPGPRTFEPPEPTPSLRRLNSSDHDDLQELSQLHHQPSAGTLSSRPGQSFSTSATSRRPSPAMTTSSTRHYRDQPSMTSLSSRDTHRTWSSAYSTLQQYQDRTDDSETIMMNHLSRFSGTTSIAIDNGPVPVMPSNPTRFGSRARNQSGSESASAQTLERDERHDGVASTTRELLSAAPTSAKSVAGSKAEKRGSPPRCCWVCVVLFIVLALAATATALGWYYAIYKKHSSSPLISTDSGSRNVSGNSGKSDDSPPFAPASPPLRPGGNSTTKLPGPLNTPAPPPGNGVKEPPQTKKNSTKLARSHIDGGGMSDLVESQESNTKIDKALNDEQGKTKKDEQEKIVVSAGLKGHQGAHHHRKKKGRGS